MLFLRGDLESEVFFFKIIQKRLSSWFLLPPATKLGQGYVFTGVCDSVHGGGGVPDQPGYPPGTRYTPQAQVHPSEPPQDPVHPQTRYTPQDQVHPPDQARPPGTRYTPLGPDTPPRCRACWEILSTRGRYASYWNAILLKIKLRNSNTQFLPVQKRFNLLSVF